MKKIFFLLLFVIFTACAAYKYEPAQNSKFVLSKDIPIPYEMKIVNHKSCLVKVLSSNAKHIVFKAKVTGDSLFDYYMTLMRQKNWQLKGYVKCKQNKDSIIIFEKYPRICIILVEEKMFNTYLHIFEFKDINFLKKIPIIEENITK